MPESEDSIRNLKASQSVSAAFQAAGFPSPPSDLANIITVHVRSATNSIPVSQLASMTPGSGLLGAAAATGVNNLINGMNPMQREAMKAGVNPLDSAAVLRFSSSLNGGMGVHGAAMARGEGGSIGGNNGGRFASMRESNSAAGSLSSGSWSDTRTGIGTGYSWLNPANQTIPGFSQAQVAGAANFLKAHGASREDVNHDTKHMVHLKKHQGAIGEITQQQRAIDQRRANGEDVSADQAKLDAKKKELRGKMTPQEQKHFDGLKTIRSQDKKKMEREGPQKGVHDEKHEDRSKDNKKAGVGGAVEAERQKRTAKVERTGTAAAASRTASADALDAPEDPPPKSAATPNANASSPQQAEKPENKGSKPQKQEAESKKQPAPQKQASKAKAATPKVG